jgi:hypothetical protein
MNFKQYVETEPPNTKNEWKLLCKYDRVKMLLVAINNNSSRFIDYIEILDADEDGQVTVALKKPASAGERGDLLMDLEEFLKERIDLGITVWLEPLADKSSLRKLRGIILKEKNE